jgi:DNA-binding response OmpR family regulator
MNLLSLSQRQERYVNVNDIKWHTDKHSIAIGNTVIPLTATEFRLLYPLRHGTPVTYASLAFEVYSYRVDEKVRMMMDKHIDRLRGKMRGSGIYIYCVLNYGYLLLPEIITEEGRRTL